MPDSRGVKSIEISAPAVPSGKTTQNLPGDLPSVGLLWDDALSRTIHGPDSEENPSSDASRQSPPSGSPLKECHARYQITAHPGADVESECDSEAWGADGGNCVKYLGECSHAYPRAH